MFEILFVTGEFPPMQGGVGDYTRELGLALRDLGCQVDVVTSIQGGPVPGLTVHPEVERWSWACWPTILDLVRHLQPDLLHIQYQAAAYAMHPAVNLLPRRLRRQKGGRPRIVTTFHDLKVPYLFPKAGPLRRWVIDELARHSDAAITTNQADCESLRGRLASAPALIPIGSNIRPALPAGYRRDGWRARWGAGPDDLLLCFFGFINDRKGVDTLLQALSLLVAGECQATATGAKAIANPQLLMIGGQTGASDPTNVGYLTYIQALVANLGLENRVRWTGYIPAEEVSACFLAADLCVLPFRDGASLLHGTLHAALAHGVPIVTTQPPVPIPGLVDGENLFLVPRETPSALADAICRLAALPDLCHTVGLGARALSESFRWDTIAARTMDLYQALPVL